MISSVDWSAEPESSIFIIICIVMKEACASIVVDSEIIQGNGSVKVGSSDDVVVALGSCLAPVRVEAFPLPFVDEHTGSLRLLTLQRLQDLAGLSSYLANLLPAHDFLFLFIDVSPVDSSEHDVGIAFLLEAIIDDIAPLSSCVS